jgi:hypothetical protein
LSTTPHYDSVVEENAFSSADLTRLLTKQEKKFIGSEIVNGGEKEISSELLQEILVLFPAAYPSALAWSLLLLL